MAQVTMQTIEFQADGRKAAGYAAVPDRGGPGVILLHSWWGLTPFFKGLCNRLAAEGFVAFAPDLNDRRIAETREEATQIMEERDFPLTEAIVRSAVEQVRALPGVQAGGLAVLGFSMGASWACVLSALAPEDIKAAVLFYGIEGVDLSQTRAAFLGHFAEQDEWTPAEWAGQIEADIRSAGRQVTFYTYPKTRHWFFEADRPDHYNAEAGELAWGRTLKFLRAQL
jgi:carboxymethylenebutenolidase